VDLENGALIDQIRQKQAAKAPKWRLPQDDAGDAA
jgi:hypothetical protein